VTKHIEETYGWKFTVEPEIEIELSAQEDHSFKWDWSLMNLRSNIEACVKDQVALGLLKKEETSDVLQKIFAPWQDKETRAALQASYPLLNVADLNKPMRKASKVEVEEVA
jgi:hypothetical protein